MLFAGHESFHIREGWIRKGLCAAAEDPFFFTRPDCADELGVGRNMVKAIRYWIRATELAQSLSEKNGGKPTTRFELTRIGARLLDKDPYFEDEGTGEYSIVGVVCFHLETSMD